MSITTGNSHGARQAPKRKTIAVDPGKNTSAYRGSTLLAGGVVLAAGAILFAPSASSAADSSTLSSLQEENARLRQQLLEAQRERDSLRQGASPPPQATTPDASPEAPVAGEPPPVPVATAEETDDLGAVVVRARNRNEKLQDVPVPVSVVSGRDLERDGAVTFGSIAQRAANISVNEQNARQSSISIRGLGKQGATDAAEASVGVIVDNVFYAYGAYSWADFVDLDHVEVLRGPQGTLLGKNTTLGVVNVQTRAPRFTPESNYEITVGNRDTYNAKASVGGPIVDGLLAFRASFSVNRANGQVKNTYEDDASWKDRNRFGGRLQFLLTPTENLSARVILDHADSKQYDNGGSLLVADPANYANGASRTAGGQTFTSRLSRDWFNGYQPLYGSNRRVDVNAQQPLKNSQNGISTEINWKVNDYTLTSISAYRDLSFVARNDGDNTPFDIGYNFHTDAQHWQASQELRLTSPPSDFIDYQVGLYALKSEAKTNSKAQYGNDAGAFFASNAQYGRLNANGSGRQLLSDALRGVYTKRTENPSTTSVAAYGQLNWHVTEKATLTAGVRETFERRENSLSNALFSSGTPIGATDASAQKYFGVGSYSDLSAAQQAQIADALAIRAGRVGTLYDYREGDAIKQSSTSWLLSPSYKLNDDVLLYASASYGEKSGIVLFNTSDGSRQNADPEKALDYELGFKSSLLNRSLIFNANLFQTGIRGYQQLLQVIDPTQSTGYRTVTGNVAKVQLRGLELEGGYYGVKNWAFRFAGAYNDAIYKSFNNATCPVELGNVQAVCDFSGRELPGASKLTGNFGVEYRKPFGKGLVFHTNVNASYRSKTNLDTTLSVYGQQKAYTVTDFGIGIGTADGGYDLSLLIRNLFDAEYSINNTTYTNQAPLLRTLGDARFIGLTFRARI